ncbi:DUF6875 domain-containing protein [Pseudomonas sp. Gutcm_11s]|uniref:DUF6875 domain-containing protein n=1 Tax=Pseudomonas sp. Gutcm_11s TaxID=3026088 RepID=UPI0023616705|nr:hypothetical protein [Pseudomonas sp. Gutcm_11s]MDD0841422.1 hypothetical protein [Pseudomonas sp. Gutcm_11s]
MPNIWAIDTSPPAGSPRFVEKAYAGIKPYLEVFLTRQHPFRNGVMCPFMPKALEVNEVYFSYFDSNGSDKEIQTLIKECISFYKSRDIKAHGTVIILFEDGFDVMRLLRAHITAKVNCIRNGLMIGVLYKDSPAPSLHSNDYFPLRTPTPTLVLRDLTSQDLLFLEPEHYGVREKLSFLNSFIKKFSTPNVKGYTKKQVEQALLLRKQYRTQALRKIALFAIIVIPALAIAFQVKG